MTSKTTNNVPDVPETAPEQKAVMSDEADSGTQGTRQDETAQLKADLATAKADADQWRDRFLRKAAEFENYRKRSDRERAEASTLVMSSIIEEFLPILDGCERALKSFREETGQAATLRKYREGVELIYKQLVDTINRLGVTPIEAKGRKFDPHFHEAVTRQETLEFEDNTVIEELRRGYLFKDRLLRPAQVVVAGGIRLKTNEGVTQ
jgi:molecular chaperone GrpE